jgi:hypothetical protein
VLENVSRASNAKNIDALKRGLQDIGYVENLNLVLEYRSADGDAGRFPALADEFVLLRVDLITGAMSDEMCVHCRKRSAPKGEGLTRQIDCCRPLH